MKKSKQMNKFFSHHLSIAILSIVNLCPTLVNCVTIGALAMKSPLFLVRKNTLDIIYSSLHVSNNNYWRLLY